MSQGRPAMSFYHIHFSSKPRKKCLASSGILEIVRHITPVRVAIGHSQIHCLAGRNSTDIAARSAAGILRHHIKDFRSLRIDRKGVILHCPIRIHDKFG